MFDYLVTLKKQPEVTKLSGSRADLYERGVAQTSEFLQRLRQWLKEQDLCEEVAALGPPLAFSLVTLTCTPKVADLIASIPDVESVFRDSRDIQFVR